MPASPLEPVLGMVETDGIDTVDNGFFSWNEKKIDTIQCLCIYLVEIDLSFIYIQTLIVVLYLHL